MPPRLLDEIDEENVTVIEMRDDGGLIQQMATAMDLRGRRFYLRSRINKK